MKSENNLEELDMDSRKDYVDTSIGKMPIDWTLSTIEDNLMILTDYHANGSYKKLKENVELFDTEDYAVMIRTTNFEQNDFSNNLKYISEHAYNFLSKSKVYKNDILMNKIANAGSVYLMPDIKKPVSLAMNLFLLRFNENINQQYAYYFLKYKEPYIKLNAAGTAAKTITKDSVRKFPLFIPPMKEQEKIVAVLNALSSKIELNNQMNETLEEMAQALFKRWFVGFEFPNEEGQPYKSSGGEMVKSELGMIPNGWNIKNLSDIVDNFDSKRIPLSKREREKREKIYPYYGAASIADYVDDFIFDGCYVLMGEDGTVIDNNGYPILQYVWGKFWVNNHAHVLQGKNYYSNEFVYLKLKSTNVQSLVTGAVQPKINQKNMNSIKTVVAPKEIHIKFNQLMESIYSKYRLNIEQNESLKQLRDSILPKLMSGEIRVIDLC